jgi:hypothetical protein
MTEQSEDVSIGDLNATDRDVLIFVAQLQVFQQPPEATRVCDRIQDERDITDQSVYNSLDNLTQEYGCLQTIDNKTEDRRKGDRYEVTDRGCRFLDELHNSLGKISHIFVGASDQRRRSGGNGTGGTDRSQQPPKTDGGVEVQPSAAVHARSVAEDLFAVLDDNKTAEETLYKLSIDDRINATREQIERAVRLYPKQFVFDEATAEPRPTQTVKTVRLTEQAQSQSDQNWKVMI